jgi:hypothetical protein
MLEKFGPLTWRDIYRAPCALVLLPFILRNYRRRAAGLAPDAWYWPDALLFRWGYSVEWW